MKTLTADQAATELGTTKLILLAALRNAGITTKYNRPNDAAINNGHLVIPDSAANYSPSAKAFISPLFTKSGIEWIRTHINPKPQAKLKSRRPEKRCYCCGNGTPILKLEKIGKDLICKTCISEQESINIATTALAQARQRHARWDYKMSNAVTQKLSPAKLNGIACIHCGSDSKPMRPVSDAHSESSAQLFTCNTH